MLRRYCYDYKLCKFANCIYGFDRDRTIVVNIGGDIVYQMIYDYIVEILIGDVAAGQYTDDLAVILTHLSIILLFVFLIRVLCWCFSTFKGLIKW